MRLIDADNMKTVREIQMANFNSIEGVREWIDRQPTAYDVEGVVSELEDKSAMDIFDKAWYVRKNEAIRIVRKGGVE